MGVGKSPYLVEYGSKVTAKSCWGKSHCVTGSKVSPAKWGETTQPPPPPPPPQPMQTSQLHHQFPCSPSGAACFETWTLGRSQLKWRQSPSIPFLTLVAQMCKIFRHPSSPNYLSLRNHPMLQPVHTMMVCTLVRLHCNFPQNHAYAHTCGWIEVLGDWTDWSAWWLDRLKCLVIGRIEMLSNSTYIRNTYIHAGLDGGVKLELRTYVLRCVRWEEEWGWWCNAHGNSLS